MSARAYAMWGGALLVALGIVGLFAGIRVLALNSETVEDLLHVVAGGVLVWAGSHGSDGQTVTWTRLIAFLFLVLGLVAFVSPDLFGLFTYELSRFDTVLHLLYGVVGVWAGWRVRPNDHRARTVGMGMPRKPRPR
ncbi:MAG TPA: hypothetical protein VFJ45_10215 [bacterium]|nr:hypothetical protein [bacterium]